MRFEGSLYRALNPIFAHDPLSGQGAAQYGGRFNAKGQAALYTSLSVWTAIKEANQIGALQPTTLVSYRARIENIFDARDQTAIRSEGFDPEALRDPAWRHTMRDIGEAPSQSLARRLSDRGYTAILTPSFVRGATADDVNLVLWHWNRQSSSTIEVVDDENRLPGATS